LRAIHEATHPGANNTPRRNRTNGNGDDAGEQQQAG
jgi:hypothetical protein